MKKFVEKILDTWIDEEPDIPQFDWRDVAVEYGSQPTHDTGLRDIRNRTSAQYQTIATSAANYYTPRYSPSVSPSVQPSFSVSVSPSLSYSPSPSFSPSDEPVTTPSPDEAALMLWEIKRDIRSFLESALGYYSYSLAQSDQTNIINFLRWYLSRLYGRGEITNGRCGFLGSQIYVGLTFPYEDPHREYFLRWNVCPMKGIEDATADDYAAPAIDAELEKLFKWEDI
jgi:hypothetical protein